MQKTRSGFAVYSLASDCSEIFVLKTKSISGMHGYDAIKALQLMNNWY
jgi:hypothetical protein